MSTVEMETAIIRMGDIGVAIDMVDTALVEGQPEQAERAVIILREAFDSRNRELQTCFFGGERND